MRLQTANYFLFGHLNFVEESRILAVMYTQYSLKQRGLRLKLIPGGLYREVKVPSSADSHLHVSASLCANYSLTNRASG